MAAVPICSDFGAPQKKSHTVFTVSPDAMIFIFWMLSFKPTFSVSTFTFIKRLFSSSSLKSDKGTSKKENYRWVFLTNIDAKILNKNVSKPNPTTYKKDHIPCLSWIHHRVTRIVQHMQISPCDTPHQQNKR